MKLITASCIEKHFAIKNYSLNSAVLTMSRHFFLQICFLSFAEEINFRRNEENVLLTIVYCSLQVTFDKNLFTVINIGFLDVEMKFSIVQLHNAMGRSLVALAAFSVTSIIIKPLTFTILLAVSQR